MRRLSHLARDARGSIAILAAVAMGMAAACAALAVDLGSVFYESRRLQGVADAAAIAAADDLAQPSHAAQSAIDGNHLPRPVTAMTAAGLWRADPALAVPNRFTATTASPNAARVTLSEDAPLYFGRVLGLRNIHLSRSATAARIDLASFSLGSRLAALDGGIANQVLSGLTGSSISLTALDYNALLGADVDLFSFTNALRAELSLNGSYADALATSTTASHVLNALISALTISGQSAAATAVGKLIGGVGDRAVNLSSLIDLGPIGQQDHAAPGQSIAVNGFGLVEALLELGGQHQIQLDLGSSIAGLSSVKATLVIGDRMESSPWIAVTANGNPVVRTSQMRLYVDTAIGGSPALRLLGVSAVRLPLYVELAEAEAKLSSLNCSAGNRGATLAVLPSIGHVSIADVTAANLSDMTTAPIESPATIVNIAGIKVTGSARTDLSGDGWQTVTFDAGEIDGRATKTVDSDGIVGAIAGSLVGKLHLNVAGFALPGLSGLVSPLLSAAAPPVDQLLSGLLDLLGLHLGQADVRINGVRCGQAALVA